MQRVGINALQQEFHLVVVMDTVAVWWEADEKAAAVAEKLLASLVGSEESFAANSAAVGECVREIVAHKLADRDAANQGEACSD